MDNIWLSFGSKTLPKNTARQGIDWWQSSLVHCVNMLNEHHERMGVDVAASQRGTIYAVQVFS